MVRCLIMELGICRDFTEKYHFSSTLPLLRRKVAVLSIRHIAWEWVRLLRSHV